MKLITPVIADSAQQPFRLSDRIVLLGSCFADSIGARLTAAGFSTCINPFGTLYNPLSILEAVRRLDSGEPFDAADCVEMGAGAGRICSFRHHTSFARSTQEEFLQHANEELARAREAWMQATRVIITLGTAFVWYHDGQPVANCLKRPAAEFTRRMLNVSEISEALQAIISAHPEKRFTITVSPIRHMGDGAHANALSKASLMLGAKDLPADYFPAYEIMMDELRDYRFYADDMLHPSDTAVRYIWERFLGVYVDPADLPAIAANEKAARIASHRPNLQ